MEPVSAWGQFATATTTDDVAVQIDVESTDADAESITYTVRWFADDVAVTEYDDLLALPAGATAKGQVWSASVTPVAGGVSGAVGLSGDVEIVDTPPTTPVVSVVDTATTGDDISVSTDVPSTDADDD